MKAFTYKDGILEDIRNISGKYVHVPFNIIVGFIFMSLPYELNEIQIKKMKKYILKCKEQNMKEVEERISKKLMIKNTKNNEQK